MTTSPKTKTPPAPPLRLKKDAIWRAMLTRTEVTIQGMVNKIEVEDGSGSSFIVTLSTGQKLWHRTAD